MSDPLPRLTEALADRYRLERELGQGGMATVYLAEDLKHKRNVALKVLKPELAAVLGAERFVQEITTTAALSHPHILPLFDSGTADGFLYYVMPYIQGETLRARLDRETQLGVDEAVRITTDVADALDYAHQQGVIHRDIKPENILLHNGRPMVADFGIALAVSAAAGGRMTETGLSLGTPHYMSPEQATAEKEISARSDIYSLASVLYEMLAGSPPHSGGSAQQIIMKIVTEEAAPVTRMRKAVPPNVAAAVAKALEKLPADRFESAKAFAEALGNPHFTTATTRAAGAGPQAARWRGALIAGLILGGFGGAAAVHWLVRPVAAAVERGREQLTFNGESHRPAISPDGGQIAYVQTACSGTQCRSSLMVQEVGSTQAKALLRDAVSLEAPRWSHDGQTVVVGGTLDEARTGLFAIPRLSGTPTLIGPSGAYDTHPTADSVVVVPYRVEAPGVALVIDLAGGAVRDSFAIPLTSVEDLSWAPGARHFAVRVGDGLAVIDRTGRQTAALAMGMRQTIRWGIDGRALLFFRVGTVRDDRFVRVPVDRDGRITGAAEVLLPRVPTLYRGEFDVARGTGRLVLGTGDAITDIWAFDLGARPATGRRVTRGTTWYGVPALSLDGRALYYYRGDALGDNVYTLDLATGTEEALTAQRLPGGNAMRLSADGRRLAYGHAAEGMTRLEYIEFPSRRVRGDTVPIRTARIVPVGSSGFLAWGSATGAVGLLDSLGGTWTPLALPDSLNVTEVAASPEGDRIAFIATGTDLFGERGTGTGVRGLSRPAPRFVGVAALNGSGARILRTLDPNERIPGLSWDRDGMVYLGRWLPADDRPSIWRMAVTDGALTRLADLPMTCIPETLTVGALGRAAACTVDDLRSDIWLLDIVGVAR